MPYTELFFGGQGSGAGTMYMVILLFVVLLLILSSNVATMVFARTATRENEIAVRYALGASRGQLLLQFFVEGLVLALIATAIGLGVITWGTAVVTKYFWQQSESPRPFWMDNSLSPSTVLHNSGQIMPKRIPVWEMCSRLWADSTGQLMHSAGR